MKIECEAGCEADFIALADDGGEDVEQVECGQHHPDFADAPSVDEFLAHIEKQAGISSEFFNRWAGGQNHPSLVPIQNMTLQKPRSPLFLPWDISNL